MPNGRKSEIALCKCDMHYHIRGRHRWSTAIQLTFVLLSIEPIHQSNYMCIALFRRDRESVAIMAARALITEANEQSSSLLVEIE